MQSVKKQMNVVLLAFKDADDKILLNRRADADTDMWELIGGGIEDGESPLEAIMREIEEEVGYTLNTKKDDLRFVYTFGHETDKVSASVHFFTANFPGIESFSDSDETYVADLKLYNHQDALGLSLLPMTRRILEEGRLAL